MNNNRIFESGDKGQAERTVFKRKIKDALVLIENEYGINIELGPISTRRYGSGNNIRLRMTKRENEKGN